MNQMEKKNKSTYDIPLCKLNIIDPLTCLCKLAVLHFMPSKTRIAITNHVLHIQQYSYYQWIERKINRDSRADISYLNSPIIKYIQWYILDDTLDPDIIRTMKNIAKYAVLGLIKLRDDTYQDDLGIRIILQYFINNIESAMDEVLDSSQIIGVDKDNIISDDIRTDYEPDIIHSISKMLSDADNQTDKNNVNALVDCIHKLLINRDTNFVKLMEDVNTVL
jgi:hypothetical protein